MDARDAQTKLIEALRVVRDRKAAGADDWEFSLLRTFLKYLEAIGIERELCLPVGTMYAAKWNEIQNTRRRNSGKRGMKKPLGKEFSMVFAAASVTVLKKQGPVDETLASVARTAGIERKALKSFRDNINRGLISADASHAYQTHVAELKNWPRKEIMKSLGLLRGFVS